MTYRSQYKPARYFSFEKGFSLIEVLIALFLGILLLVMVFPAFLGNIKTFRTVKAVVSTQENARFAMSEISTAIRSTGFRGCDSSVSTIQNLTGESSLDFDNNITGVERAAAEAIANVDTSAVSPKDGTDAITIKSLFVVNSELLTDATQGDTELTVRSAGKLSVGDVLFIGNCESALMLNITGISGTTITVNQALPGGSDFSKGTTLYRFEKTIYFIAQSQLYVNSAGDTPNSLWRKRNTGSSIELVAGIEDLQFIYGLDSDADGVPNQYLNASSVGAGFANVASVRMKLESTSLDSVNDGGVISKPFSMTVNLRNQM